MDLLKLIFGMLLACVLFVACAPDPQTEMGEEVPAVESDGVASVSTMAEVKEAIRSIEDRNEVELFRVASDNARISSVVDEIRSMRWAAQPPKDSQDTQTAVYDDMRLQVTGMHGDFVKLIGERYTNGEISGELYQNAMRITAAVLDGILHSHESIADPNVDSINSILTYAALLRAAISSELKKHGFEGEAVLTQEQHGLLREAAQYQRYELFDDLP